MTDWLATFAEITGQSMPPDTGEDSLSLLPLLRGESTSVRENIIHHTPFGQFAIRQGDWLYIDHFTGDANNEPDWFRTELGVVAHALPVELLAFYDFPAEHWMHIRTTNQHRRHVVSGSARGGLPRHAECVVAAMPVVLRPIESVFATVRLRTKKTRGSGSRKACLTMVFKLVQSDSKRWRSLNGSALLEDVILNVAFVDGLRKSAA